MAARKRKGRARKGAYGEGSIQTDAAGRIYYQPPRRDGERPSRQRCLDANHAEEVKRAWLEQDRKRRDGDLDTDTGDILLHSWLPEWFEIHHAPHLAETTKRNDKTSIRKYLLLLPNKPIKVLSTDTIAKWQNRLGETYSVHVVRRAVALLDMALQRAMDSGRITRNPVRAVTKLKPPRETKKKIVLTDAQLARALAAVSAVERYVLLWLIALLGLRCGEALGLLWSDLVGGRLTVRGQAQTYGREVLLLDDTKTHRTRTITLPDLVLSVLEAQRRRVYERRLRAGPTWNDHDLIFPNDIGQPQKANTIYRAWTRLLAGLGLPAADIHSLRHGAITRLDVSGVRTRVLKEIAGHALDTHERYIKVTDADVRQALERAMAAMGKDEEGRAAK